MRIYILGVAVLIATTFQTTFAIDANTMTGIYNGCREVQYSGVSTTLCYKGLGAEPITLDTTKMTPLPDLLYGCKDIIYQGVSMSICYTGTSPKQALRKELQNTNWEIYSLNGAQVMNSGSLSFGVNTVQAKLCNTMIGSYFAISKTLITRNLASTRMYCSSDIMSVESAFSHASRSQSTIDGDALTLRTPTGDVLIWKKK